jgi:hypothetical protein
MKKYFKIILPLAVILIIGFTYWQSKITNSIPINTGETSAQKPSAVLVIDGKNSGVFDISNSVGKTALEATESKVTVNTKGSGTDAYVISINGYEAGAEKHEFWEFNVNGNQAPVGAGSYIVQNNDEIQWKISNY